MRTFRLDIPWAHLCPDNQKQIPVPVIAKYAGQRCVSRLMTLSRYKNGKAAIALVAADVIDNFHKSVFPLFDEATPLSLIATAYPPNRRKTDPINYAKGICDALQGIVYVDDNQIVSNGPWIRGRVDKDNPRIEVVITPLDEEES